jgi:hypothetical protein
MADKKWTFWYRLGQERKPEGPFVLERSYFATSENRAIQLGEANLPQLTDVAGAYFL